MATGAAIQLHWRGDRGTETSGAGGERSGKYQQL